MRACHRGRLVFCPCNSHFDQFEFFAGAATVDFTTETSSSLFARLPRSSFSSRFFLSLFLSLVDPFSLSLVFLTLARGLPFSAISSLFLSHARAYVKSHLPFHVLLPSAQWLTRSLMLSFRDVRIRRLDGEKNSDGLLAGGVPDSWHSSVLRIAAEVPRTRSEFCVSCCS